MFTTVNNVKQYTNQDVAIDLVSRAHNLIEIFIGKPEIDIENVNDLMILDKMTAYQAAYMLDNEDIIYKQIASLSVGTGDSNQNYDTKMFSPFIAPLAVLASKGLTFKRSRSLKTGKIFQLQPFMDWTRL